jgi:putative transposase
MPIDRKTARNYMQEMDVLAIYPKPNLSKPHPEHRLYPYLLRDVTPAYPNHVWSSDSTYIRPRDGWLFLMVVRRLVFALYCQLDAR